MSTEEPSTVARVDVEAIERDATAAVEAAATSAELEDARVHYLGRKSDLKLALRQVRDRESGMALNAARERLEAAFAAREEELERAELERRLTQERVDVTLPGEPVRRGHLHPITQVRRIVEDAFVGLGYHVRYDRELETAEYNFDKLEFPPWHPARSPRATFFLDGGGVLRTETSPSQIREMEEYEVNSLQLLGVPVYCVYPEEVPHGHARAIYRDELGRRILRMAAFKPIIAPVSYLVAMDGED